MPRKSAGPRYYPSSRTWFANIGHKRYSLVHGDEKETKEQAWKLYNQLKDSLDKDLEGDRKTVFAILNCYLVNAQTRTVPAPLEAGTWNLHHATIADFVAFNDYKDIIYKDLRWSHFEEWLTANSERWGDNERMRRLKILRAAFSWAAGEGELVTANPFKSKGGKGRRLPSEDLTIRRLTIREDEHRTILDYLSRRKKGNFDKLLQLLYGTGARPAELWMAWGDEWNPDLQAFVIDPKNKARCKDRLKTRRYLLKRGRKRIIRVPDELRSMVEELVAQYPDGQLFRRENGRVWDRKEITNRFRRMRAWINRRADKKKLPKVRDGLTLYSYRHSFVTRWLKAGQNVMVLCELLNTSLKEITERYSHLFEAHDELLGALNAFSKQAAPPAASSGGALGQSAPGRARGSARED